MLVSQNFHFHLKAALCWTTDNQFDQSFRVTVSCWFQEHNWQELKAAFVRFSRWSFWVHMLSGKHQQTAHLPPYRTFPSRSCYTVQQNHLYLKSMCVCAPVHVCLCMCVCTCVHTDVEAWGFNGGVFLNNTLPVSSSISHCTWSSWLWLHWLASTPRDPPVSASQHWGYRRNMAPNVLMWVVGTWTQVLGLTWRTF